MTAGLRPSGNGYVLTVDGHQWTIRPAFPGGWELVPPNGSAVAWMDTVEECAAYARGEGEVAR